MNGTVARQSPPFFDLIVIGAGAIGSAAAYHAARDGRKVLLIEQFTVGHKQGSSHGGSRITRYAHDQRWYAEQMPATFALWRELEQLSGTPLLQMTGGLYLGAANEPWLVNCQTVLDELGFDYTVLDSAGLRSTFPQFMTNEEWIGVRQDETGILAASQCVAVMVDQAVAHGATVIEEMPVVAVSPEGEGVAVRTTEGRTFYADSAVVAAGPWATRFLDDLVPFHVPLRVTRQQTAYFAARNPADFAVGKFPVFILVADPHIYGFPIFERPGEIKIALEQTEQMVDPDEPRTVDQELLARLVEAVQMRLPGLEPSPTLVEPCLYTETPTRDFVIDRHPEHPQIVLAAGFSGRGFKHSIAVGRLLADLAQSAADEYTSPFWHDTYRLTRFRSLSV